MRMLVPRYDPHSHPHPNPDPANDRWLQISRRHPMVLSPSNVHPIRELCDQQQIVLLLTPFLALRRCAEAKALWSMLMETPHRHTDLDTLHCHGAPSQHRYLNLSRIPTLQLRPNSQIFRREMCFCMFDLLSSESSLGPAVS